MYFFRTDIGRLGNQMFIYAFANAISTQRKTNYCLSEIGRLNIFQLGVGEERFFNRLKNNLYHRWIIKTNNVPIIDNAEVFKFFDPSIIPNCHAYLIGHFQSHIYFNEIENKIRKRFKFKNEIRAGFLKFKKRNNIPDNYTAVHIRRTDYINHKINGLNDDNTLALPVEYYLKAIAELDLKNNFLVFVTDDPEFVEQEFKFLPNKLISSSVDYIDFQLIQNAKTCIIANSTFSWWAAWLNKQAKVYCPRYFLGFNDKIEVPQNIYPPYWAQIEF